MDTSYLADVDPRPEPGRVWFWRPERYWHGWRTLFPAFRGSDEYGRRTVVLGWTITGRVVIAYRICGCDYCDAAREQTAREAEERGAW